MNIIISGGSSGLGRALALTYANKNNTLGLIGRNATTLQDVATLCEQQGAKVILIICDLSVDFKVLKQKLTAFHQQFNLDLVIANAGITASSSAQRELEPWQVTKTLIDTNVLGVLGLLHPIVHLMQQQQSGQIVIISSIAAFYGMPITPSYCASKAAIKSYGEALRGLLYEDQIQVCLVYPGFIKTAMSDQFPGPKPFMMSPKKAAMIIQRGIQKRKKVIAFPFWLSTGMAFLPLLPSSIADFILRNYRDKK